MAYNPDLLEPGDIILCYGTGYGFGALLDYAIRFATLSKYDHACIVSEHRRIVNPVWHVGYAPLDLYQTHADAFRIEAATVGQRNAAAAWARHHIGQSYGLRELLEDGGRSLLHIPFMARIHESHWTCSGFVAAAYQSADVTLSRAPLPSPGDLYNSPLLIPTAAAA